MMLEPDHTAEHEDLQRFRDAYLRARARIQAERSAPGASWFAPQARQAIFNSLHELRNTAWIQRIKTQLPTDLGVAQLLSLQQKRKIFSPEAELVHEGQRDEARRAWHAEQELFFLRMYTDIVAEDWRLQERFTKNERKQARETFCRVAAQLDSSVQRLQKDLDLMHFLELQSLSSANQALVQSLTDLQKVRAAVQVFDEKQSAGRERLRYAESKAGRKVLLHFDGREVARDIARCCLRSFGVCSVTVLRLLAGYERSSAAYCDDKVLKLQLNEAVEIENSTPNTLEAHSFDVDAVAPKGWRVALCVWNKHWAP
jgi:hypothetical protein